MTSFDRIFLLFLVGVAIAVFFLIRFLLKANKSFEDENLQLKSDDIWKIIASRASQLGLSRADLLFGIYQNPNSTTTSLVVKNSDGEIVGRAEKTLGEREARIFIDETLYKVEYPLSFWKRKIELHAQESILSICTEMNFPIGQLRYDFPNRTSWFSKRMSYLNFLYQDNFCEQGQVIAMVQSIDSRTVGRIGVFPSILPLAVRIFILAHPLF
jgi:hypothetical protein